MKLWLDDERPAPEGWIWIKTADEAIHLLESMRSCYARDPGGAVVRTCMGFKFDDRHRSVPIYWKEFWTITHMSFDHDLADVHYDYWHAGQTLPQDHPTRAQAREIAAREKTGYDVLLWMAEHNVWPTEACSVHSHNSVGAERMVGVINRYGPYTTRCRWTPYDG